MTAILVTRPGGVHDPVVAALIHAGYRVHAVPTVATRPVPVEPHRLDGCDWIVLTSARGVRALDRLPREARYAAVGAATAEALRARGVEPAHVPERADAEALGSSLPEVAGKRVALVRASAAGEELVRVLQERGARVEDVTAYETVEGPEGSREPLAAALAAADLAAVVFASGSAVRGYVTLGGRTSLPAVTIGPRTTRVARELGFDVVAEAAEQSAEGLVAGVLRAVRVGQEERYA